MSPPFGTTHAPRLELKTSHELCDLCWCQLSCVGDLDATLTLPPSQLPRLRHHPGKNPMSITRTYTKGSPHLGGLLDFIEESLWAPCTPAIANLSSSDEFGLSTTERGDFQRWVCHPLDL